MSACHHVDRVSREGATKLQLSLRSFLRACTVQQLDSLFASHRSIECVHTVIRRDMYFMRVGISHYGKETLLRRKEASVSLTWLWLLLLCSVWLCFFMLRLISFFLSLPDAASSRKNIIKRDVTIDIIILSCSFFITFSLQFCLSFAFP